MENKIKIAFFMDGGEGGGVVEYIRLLVSHLDRNKFYRYGVFIGKGNSYNVLGHLFDETKILTNERLVNSNFSNNKILLNLKKIQIAILALFRFSKYIRFKNIQIIDVSYFPHHLIAGVASRINKRICIWHWHGASTLSRSKNFLVKYGVKYLSFKIISISKFVENSLPKTVMYKSKVIYNGISIPPVQKDPPKSLHEFLNIDSSERLIGIIGTLTPIKGHQDFINAADIVFKKGYKAKFLIIGKETEAHKNKFNYTQKLSTQISKLQLNQNVLMTGPIPSFSEYISSLHIVIMPTIPIGSVKGEGFGLVAAEAMAASVPVIATTTGAFPEIITNGVEGVLISPQSPEMLADAMIELLRDPNYREVLASNGRLNVVNKFDIINMTKSMETLYYESLKR